MRQTLVFSDLHLSPAAAGTGAWMRFRQPRYFADEAFGALVEDLLGRLGAAPLEVVFNGDTFELDGAAAFEGPPDERDENVGRAPAEAAHLARILADHPGMVRAMARLLDRAEHLVFVSGNHDQGLCWPEVQETLRAHLAAAAHREGPGPGGDPGSRIAFAPWFHRTQDGIHVEHGHQLDPDSAVPDPLVPRRPDGEGLWLSLGSAGLRHILGRIGTMNPHVPGSFRLGGPLAYLGHFARYYLGRGRPLLRTWVFGAIRCARHVLRQQRLAEGLAVSTRLDALAAEAARTGLRAGQVRRLRALHVAPVATRPFAVWRTLWLDRLAFAAGGLAAALGGWLLGGWVAGLVGLALVVTGLVTYEHLVTDTPSDAYEASLPWAADRVAGITGAPAVVFGHTHAPSQERLPGGAVYVNTGAWAPAFADAECTRPVRQDRTFTWIRTDQGRVVTARLLAWQRGALVAFDGALLPDFRRQPEAVARAA